MGALDTSRVNRFELIDHRPCNTCKGTGLVGASHLVSDDGKVICPDCDSGVKGRELIFWNANTQVELSLQDNNRTLKVFIKDKG